MRAAALLCACTLALGSSCAKTSEPASQVTAEGPRSPAAGGSTAVVGTGASTAGTGKLGDYAMAASDGSGGAVGPVQAVGAPASSEPTVDAGGSQPGTGIAALPPSCEGSIGLCNGETCCASAKVNGCTECVFPVGHTSTVNDFLLDKYEVTVGRFRRFLDSYRGSPTAGAGAHPWIAGSGWQSAWDKKLPTDRRNLLASSWTWTDTPGKNEEQPISGVSWYGAFAFCAWDGGFLPTELEWQYAAAGGAENRSYPWAGSTLDHDHAVYSDCVGAVRCLMAVPIGNVGSKPAGAGRWGQYDLAGSMLEWVMGSLVKSFPNKDPCDNCAVTEPSPYAICRGGAWAWDGFFANASVRAQEDPEERLPYVGFRCARAP